MQTQARHAQYARLNTFHGPKKALLGDQAGVVAPSWRTSNTASKGPAQEMGSKILLSRLPVDVGERDVEELFRKTVGPLKDSFLVYNSQGKSKGMAVVTFQRSGDAAVARGKYNGKVVDGRRPIKIEIIKDYDPPQSTTAQAAPTLLNRLGGAPTAAGPAVGAQPSSQPSLKTAKVVPSVLFALGPVKPPAIPPRRLRVKKGPRRLQKVNGTATRTVTRDQLDKEMDDYRASAPSMSY